jgi:hypothetical protein
MNVTDDDMTKDLAYLRQKIFAGLGIPDATLVGRPASDMAELRSNEDVGWLERSLGKILSEEMRLRIGRMLKEHTLLEAAIKTRREFEALSPKSFKVVVACQHGIRHGDYCVECRGVVGEQ